MCCRTFLGVAAAVAGPAPVAAQALVDSQLLAFDPAALAEEGHRDPDAVIGRTTKKSGKVTNGPMDVPGGGRIAQLSDPQGAAFAVHEPPKK